MAERDWNKLRGLHQLVHDGVREVTSFVEKHHRHAANKPFDALEAIPPAAAPSRLVRVVHDGVLTTVYGNIHAVNAATQQLGEWVVDRLEAAQESPAPPEPSDAAAADDEG